MAKRGEGFTQYGRILSELGGAARSADARLGLPGESHLSRLGERRFAAVSLNARYAHQRQVLVWPRLHPGRRSGYFGKTTTRMVSTSLLPGFMVKRQLSFSRLTTLAQDSFFPPTIVQRQIEAIRPKRACPGSALSLSSERGLIG
jgi:hypothetical protein